VAHRSTSVPSSWKGSLCFTTRTTQKTMITFFSFGGVSIFKDTLFYACELNGIDMG
jgi:hypothetical protein